MTRPDPPPTEAPAPPGRTQGGARLPWTLVVILSVAVLGLTGLLGVREKELADARAQGAAPAPSATTAASADEDADVEAMMRALPRRDADDPRALGRVDAPVVLIDWSDFRCPFCAHWSNTTLTDLQPYVEAGQLRIEFRDLVLFGEESRLAAIASRAAGEQDKFWEFSAALFTAAPASGHPTITETEVIAFARAAGVPDLDRFQDDLGDPDLAAAVDAETAEARSLGISGTPFFLVNTTPISGAQPLETFTQTIESYLSTR